MQSENVMSQSSASSYRRNESHEPDRRVLRGVRQWALAGLALVLVWPAARGYSSWIGWLPLWLVGMPLVAWWALYRFRLPAAWRAGGDRRVRRRRPQARRFCRPAAARTRKAA
jgi:fatty acid desaturase